MSQAVRSALVHVLLVAAAVTLFARWPAPVHSGGARRVAKPAYGTLHGATAAVERPAAQPSR